MKKYYVIFGEGSKVNQVICAILINLVMFVYGNSIGWMSPMTHLLQSEHSPRSPPLTEIQVSWMGAVTYLACVPANFLLAYLSDNFGRKFALMLLSFTAMLIWIIKLSSMEVWALILARTIGGILMACYVTAPLYIKEISDLDLRGIFGSWTIVFHTLGNLFLYIIGDVLSYNATLWVCLSIPAVHLLLCTMIPESPSYLVKKRRYEDALKVISWLKCRSESHPVVQRELDLIKKEQENDDENNNKAGIFKTVWKDKLMRRAYWIVLIVALSRELCGSGPILNYAGDIFAKASKGFENMTLTPNQQAIILGVVQVAGSLFATIFVERFGRKFLIIVTTILSGASLCVLASWFVARSYEIWVPGWLPVTLLCAAIFCDAGGLLPVTIVMTTEMFSYRYRGSVIASTMASADILDFVEMLAFKPLTSLFGAYIAFYIFGFVCLASAVYTIIVIPETKLKSVDEIYDKLKTKKEKEKELKDLNALEYRGSVIASTMASADILDFVEMLAFKPLTSLFGAYIAFYIFGFVCLASAVYTIIVIPETKLKSVDEIYDKLKTKKEKEKELKDLNALEVRKSSVGDLRV